MTTHIQDYKGLLCAATRPLPIGDSSRTTAAMADCPACIEVWYERVEANELARVRAKARKPNLDTARGRINMVLFSVSWITTVIAGFGTIALFNGTAPVLNWALWSVGASVGWLTYFTYNQRFEV